MLDLVAIFDVVVLKIDIVLTTIAVSIYLDLAARFVIVVLITHMVEIMMMVSWTYLGLDSTCFGVAVTSDMIDSNKAGIA